MQAMEAARALGAAIQESPEYQEYARLKEEVEQDAGIKSLLGEYRRLQTAIQMRMLGGQGLEDDDSRRFQQLGALLFADSRTSGYLMAEMRLQKMMADIFETLTSAAGMEIPLPQ